MKFSRGRGIGRHARGDAGRASREVDDLDRFGDGSGGASDPEYGDAGDDGPAGSRAGGHSKGPHDVTEAPPGVSRLDLGSLLIPTVEGVEVRVQADPDGTIQQVLLAHEDSALQLGVFAAPRSEGIWDEVRDEIHQSLRADGAAAEEIHGEYGAELRARLRGPDGQTDMRFVGVDGPRWMVRGVFYGRAAVDPEAAGPLLACLHGLVVDRGHEAKPVREPLPLRLPREMAAEAQQAQAQQTQQTQAQPAQAQGPGANGAAGSPDGAVPPGTRRRHSPRRRG